MTPRLDSAVKRRSSTRTDPRHAFRRLREELAGKASSHLAVAARSIHESLFRQQRDFLLDTARRKSLCTPRRVGKTWTLGSALLDDILTRSERNDLYLSLTKEHGRDIIWDWIHRRDTELKLGLQFNNTRLTVRAPNGSKLKVAGAATRDEAEKTRGSPYDMVAIDEAQAFAPSLLSYLTKECIGPGLADRKGTLILAGTPGAILAGPFYQATHPRHENVRPHRQRHDLRWKGRAFSWSFHTWTMEDNITVPGLWEEALEIKRSEGWTDDNPKWRREFLGEWVSDETQFVYAYNREGDGRNDFVRETGELAGPFGLPAGHRWSYLAGMDLGYEDDFAFEVAACADTHPCLFYIPQVSFSRPHLVTSEIGALILRMQSVIEAEDPDFAGFEALVADTGGMGVAIVEELNRILGLGIEPAEKQRKKDYIELFNGDLIDGRIKVEPTSTLAQELRTVQWNKDWNIPEKRERAREDKRFANHSADAALYVWRHARHHYWRPPVAKLEPGSPAWERERQKAEILEATRRRRMARGEEWWDGLAAGMDDDSYLWRPEDLVMRGGDDW